MKKIIFINLAIFSMLFLFSSCEDYLSIAPKVEISKADVFTDFKSTQGYLDNCKNSLNDYSAWNSQGQGREYIAGLSDEGTNTYIFGSVKGMNGGQWLGSSGSTEVGYNGGKVITMSFNGIRIANKVLENLPNKSFTDDENNQLMGQAYFYRSWFYFEIIRRWGGMFIMDKTYKTDDVLDKKRLSYSESTEWLIAGLDKAIGLLPDNWDESNKGRPDKVAAMAVKSMSALYAASPLMQNALYTAPVDNGYSIEWSKKAAKYASEVLKYIDKVMPERAVTGEGMPAAAQANNYRDIFYHYPNFVGKESLWYVNSTGKNRKIDMIILWQNIRFSGSSGNYGWAVCAPTQNIVDKYEFADGTPFDWNNPSHVANPYVGRDPRFYNNFLYPGASHGEDLKHHPLYLETWEGGRDINPTTYTKSVITGYLCKKWWWPGANFANKDHGYSDHFYNAVFIRTTQIWLDLAEAMNEAYGPNADPDGLGYTALSAVNKVRNRVGMPDVQSQFTGSKDALRERIRNERAVELLYENHRWFDLRRWMTAVDVFSEKPYPIKGVVAKIKSKNNSEDPSKYTFSYSKKDVTSEIRVFDKRNYWYPVAYDHTNQYKDFKQNYGW